ncbi:ribosomal subunit 39S-domain-containing protein [Hypoxylon cercidicola]|nr:ribosomal subunit 39S-domain-containing protein [Hypoxylon cercidicola]
MRRIPRLRRPSGLSTSSSSPIAPLVGQCHPQPTASQIAPASHRRPVQASLQNQLLARFYSADRQPTQQSLSRETEEARGEELGELDEEGLVTTEDQRWYTYVPPPRRSYAERSDEVSDPSYVPAVTASGLQTVGGLQNWWDKPDHWSNDFVAFKPSQKVLDPAVIEVSVRRAVIEAFALRQAGREDELVRAWPIREEELDRLMEVTIHVGENGAVSLAGDVSIVLETLDRKEQPSITDESTTDGSLEKLVLSAEEAQKYKDAWDHDWKAASLSDPRIKFAVTKRIFQLTGQLVLDHQLSSITDVRSLLRVVQKPPKPKTVTQEIQERRQDLVQLPNVFVATKRITRGDREKAVGRFKLIEEELKKRDLPLVGHGFTRKNRELSQLKGGI